MFSTYPGIRQTFYMCAPFFFYMWSNREVLERMTACQRGDETKRLSQNEFRGFWEMVAFTVNFLTFSPW